jgi:hypothetical protein
MAKKTKDKRTHNDLQNITQAGARHLSGFLTCKVLHLSGNFILKRAESTCVLPVFLITFLKTDFHQKLISKWNNIDLKCHAAVRIHNKMTFQLKPLE